jgi:ribosomal protein S18 acetylase RimI-like enzyme
MYIQQITFGTPDFDEALALRYAVLRQPLGLDYSEAQIAEEWNQYHLAAYRNDGALLGYLNLTPAEHGLVKMRQVAVSPAAQGQGIGAALVAASETLAREEGFSHMVLHARETAVSFYKKLGYTVEGERFEEVTIPHFKMQKKLV